MIKIYIFILCIYYLKKSSGLTYIYIIVFLYNTKIILLIMYNEFIILIIRDKIF